MASKVTLSSLGNKQVHLGTATDNRVEQYSKKKVDHRRFVKNQGEVWPFEKIGARCVDVTTTVWVPILICPANKWFLCVTLMVRLIKIERIRLIKRIWQISSLIIFEGNLFLVKQRAQKMEKMDSPMEQTQQTNSDSDKTMWNVFFAFDWLHLALVQHFELATQS